MSAKNYKFIKCPLNSKSWVLVLLSTCLILFASCGKETLSSTSSVTVSIPKGNQDIANKSFSLKSTPYATYLPIQAYLSVKDNTGSNVYEGLAPLGKQINGTYISEPKLAFKGIKNKASSLIISGYYLAQGVKSDGNICNYSGTTNATSTNSNNKYNSIFIADFTEDNLNIPLTSGIHNISPILKEISYDKLGLILLNINGTLAAANYTTKTNYNSQGFIESTTFTPTNSSPPIITSISFVDSLFNQELIDPCTGKAFNARTDSFGRITTNMPIKFSNSLYLKIKVVQFTVPENKPLTEDTLESLRSSAKTINTYDLVKNSASVQDCNLSSIPNGSPPSNHIVNTSGIPIFWKINLANSTPTLVDPTNTNYLQSSEVLDGSTTICNRVKNNFNPRFPDFPNSSTTGQVYLQPTNPLSTATPSAVYSVYGNAYYNPTSSSPTDFAFINPAAFRYFYNLNNTIVTPTSNTHNNNLVNVFQNLEIQCGASAKGLILLGTNNGSGGALATQNCTTLAYTFGASGLAQYFTTAGIAPQSSTPITVNYYIGDSEGYLVNSINMLNSSTGSRPQPNSSNPYSYNFFNWNTGAICTIANPPQYSNPIVLAGSGSSGNVNGVGTNASFGYISSIAIDSQNNIFVADVNNNSIRKITRTGHTTIFAGATNGASGSTDGNGTNARFNSPFALTIDKNDNIYVSDVLNHTIRKITPSGDVSTYAGISGSSGTTDGARLGVATFHNIVAITSDANNDIYAVEHERCVIRKISSTLVSTIAGTSNSCLTTDGVGAGARLNYPYSITMMLNGDFLLSEVGLGFHLLRSVSPSNSTVTTLNPGGIYGYVDGPIASSRISSYVVGSTNDCAGNLYLVDQANNAIRVLSNGTSAAQLVNSVVSTLKSTTNTPITPTIPAGVSIDTDGNLYYSNRYQIFKLEKR